MFAILCSVHVRQGFHPCLHRQPAQIAIICDHCASDYASLMSSAVVLSTLQTQIQGACSSNSSYFRHGAVAQCASKYRTDCPGPFQRPRLTPAVWLQHRRTLDRGTAHIASQRQRRSRQTVCAPGAANSEFSKGLMEAAVEPMPRVLSVQSHTVTGYVGNRCAVFTLQVLPTHQFLQSIECTTHISYPSKR